ncbi:MAG: rhodanese-like domain-containing protein [Vampirovibrionales bacterium]|nr:rhodanese-like domain-containing protein [Vampirovibrionales bacterium]
MQTRRGKSFQQLVMEAKSRIREVPLTEFMRWRSENRPLVILDVREPEQFDAEHIPQAIKAPRGILELEIDEMVPDQDATIVCYCGGGSRSALAADTLQAMGYENVYSLVGGFRGWSQSNG